MTDFVRIKSGKESDVGAHPTDAFFRSRSEYIKMWRNLDEWYGVHIC